MVDLGTVQVPTRVCIGCRKSSVVTVDAVSYIKWREGMLIQQAFPTLSADEREMLMTGIHKECWDRMFGGEEE